MKPILKHSTIKKSIAASAQLDQRQVQARAYQLYEQRGRAHGLDVEDWLAAEREIARQRDSTPKVAGIAA